MCREDYISITDNDGYRFWLKYAKDVRACGGLENYEAKRSALFKKATESLDPETWDGPYDKAVEAMNEQIEKFGVERVYNRTFGRHA